MQIPDIAIPIPMYVSPVFSYVSKIPKMMNPGKNIVAPVKKEKPSSF